MPPAPASISQQVFWLFILAITVATVARTIVFEEIFHDSGIKPGRLARLSGQKPTPVAREVLARFCDAKTPQHVVGLARRKETPAAELLARMGPAVYLEAVQDPGNLGANARVVEAVGAGLLASEGQPSLSARRSGGRPGAFSASPSRLRSTSSSPPKALTPPGARSAERSGVEARIFSRRSFRRRSCGSSDRKGPACPRRPTGSSIGNTRFHSRRPSNR
jgi:hypothetical protein